NYDACHLAVEFEQPQDVIRRFQEHGIKVSKLHFSSALKVFPTREARKALARFADEIYFHQVVVRGRGGSLRRYKDLDLALRRNSKLETGNSEEWRIHFHVPLHSPPAAWFETTSEHLLGIMDILQNNPSFCSHIEMETYTWEVMPPEMKNRNVVDQLADEYQWTLQRLGERGLGR